MIACSSLATFLLVTTTAFRRAQDDEDDDDLFQRLLREQEGPEHSEAEQESDTVSEYAQAQGTQHAARQSEMLLIS